MSWASRRRTAYLTGVVLFFVVVIGGPVAYWYLSVPPTCNDGIRNQGETSIDKGGPCLVLDVQALQPHATLWARSFRVRDGSYNAVAYIQNPNKDAGVRAARYRFGLYDSKNILIAEKEGVMYIMPGAVTPVIEAKVDTGSRIVAHTYFEFTEPLVWERVKDNALAVTVNNKDISNITADPRLSATVKNNGVASLTDVSFVAVIFDPAGNAFAASATALQRIDAGASSQVTFTWPDPFTIQPGRIDVIPLVAPSLVVVQN
ncbi:hypothetical protein HY971_00015 [Candidatus Kaiserbacteria bacterium]|nr:hypothetical protein [Candidatus Kaiserbacteria bacterium]